MLGFRAWDSSMSNAALSAPPGVSVLEKNANQKDVDDFGSKTPFLSFLSAGRGYLSTACAAVPRRARVQGSQTF